jgi:mycoredoxin
MITVYGADWCEDTQKAMRHLRRLGVMYVYENVDKSPEALAEAKALNNGERRTPTIDVDGTTLVEPSNDELTRALEERGMVNAAEAAARLTRRNVGDLERGLRVAGGAVAVVAAMKMKSAWKWPLLAWGAFEAVSGGAGFCPVYAAFGKTSTGGPGDHPREAERRGWLADLGS